MTITERRLAAILASDVCNFSKMMGENEDRTISNLRICREIIENSVTLYNGNIFNTAGDSIVAEFSSVVDAVNCAVNFQETLRDRNSSVSETARMEFRVGINLGDIIVEEDNRYGDGINIAARLEGLAEPGGICISGSVYRDIKSKLNLEFGDMGDQALKNIAQPVSAYKIDFGHEDPLSIASIISDEIDQRVNTSQPAVNYQKIKQAEKPSIAVLPFNNMSGDPEQEYFSDGITEDIITDLSKISGLLVIARNSSFTYKGQSPDIRKVAEELDVNHVLEGSIRKSGNRVRITAQLIEGSSGGHLWAERYDRDLTDIFEVQDEVTQQIVNALKITLQKENESEVDASSTKHVEAHDEFLRGRELILNVGRMDKDNFDLSLKHFNQAIQIDPNYSGPYAGKAFLYVLDYQNHWSDNPDAALGRARKLIELAIEKDNKDPFAYMVSSLVAVWEKDYQRWGEAADQALQINPNYAQALNSKATLFIFSGEPNKGIPFIERALRLDPAFTQYIHFLGTAYFVAEDYDKAAIEFKKRITIDPQTDLSRAFLSSALGHLGNIDEARGIWKELMEINPSYSYIKHIERLPFKEQKDAIKLGDGLRKAGLVE